MFEFFGWILLLGGCFGLGVWFTRFYDDIKKHERKMNSYFDKLIDRYK